ASTPWSRRWPGRGTPYCPARSSCCAARRSSSQSVEPAVPFGGRRSAAPAATALREAVNAGHSLPQAASAAAVAAEQGAKATIPLQARKGRASYLGERSIGHQDPGATSVALVIRALERAVSREP